MNTLHQVGGEPRLHQAHFTREGADVEVVLDPGRMDHGLWYNLRIDLKRKFPTSVWSSLQGCFSAFVVAVIAVLLRGWVHSQNGSEGIATHMDFGSWIFLVVAVGFCLLKFILSEVARYAHRYETDGFRLVISRGILFKSEGSLPLLPVSEIFVRRNLADFFFGLYEVHVATPVNATKAFGLIRGLSYENAHGLQEFLSEQLNRQVSLAPAKDTDREHAHVGR